MSNFKEGGLWSSQAWRVISHSVCMAILWALPVVIVGVIISQISYINYIPSDGEDRVDIPDYILYEVFTVGLSIVCSILGIIPGFCSGIFAPESEPTNPLKSQFFRTVGKQTLCFLLFSIGFLYFNMVLFASVIHLQIQFYDKHLATLWVAGSIVGYIVGIRRAIANALSESKQAPKID